MENNRKLYKRIMYCNIAIICMVFLNVLSSLFGVLYSLKMISDFDLFYGFNFHTFLYTITDALTEKGSDTVAALLYLLLQGSTFIMMIMSIVFAATQNKPKLKITMIWNGVIFVAVLLAGFVSEYGKMYDHHISFDIIGAMIVFAVTVVLYNQLGTFVHLNSEGEMEEIE